MQFIHSPLIWGFLLVLVPLLIHLINMVRHRRVKWAAMDFLLASYRKHRRWVWLKQLILLMLRMLAIAAVVAMLAQLVSKDHWTRLFGRRTTHHFVLFDDSLSMADRTGSGTAFDRGWHAISQMTRGASLEDQQQLITLIRYSQAARNAKRGEVVVDLNAAPITDALETMLDEQGRRLSVSQLALDVQPALDLAERLIRDTKDQRCLLHVVSDFRQADWSQPAEVRETLNRISKLDTPINLVRCVDQQTLNLSVESLTPETGTQAAGVPMFMNVVIANRSMTAAEQVRLRTHSTLFPTSRIGTESAPQETELPDLMIDRIEPGESIHRTFQVYFSTPGNHTVSVGLPSDALSADNQRWSVVNLDVGESALIVDGDPKERSAYYLESIFRPGTKAKTGIIPLTQPLSYLRDATPEELGRHRAIYLLDVPPLDARALAHLQTYVENGGGLACFLGPQANSQFYTNWYEAGLFPVPVERRRAFASSIDSPTADIRFNKHAIFRALTGQRNPFAAAIRIRRHWTVPQIWEPPNDSGISVLADLQDGHPLVVERSVGAGRCIAVLTTLAPDWNNWSLQPSFIVVALQLHAHLAESQRPRFDRKVGQPIAIQVDSRTYHPEVTFVTPDDSDGVPREVAKVAKKSDDVDASLLTAVLREPTEGSIFGETDLSGIYDAQLQTIDGKTHHRRFALNIDTRESRLSLLDASQLRQSLDPLHINIYQADQQVAAAGGSDRNSWSEILLWVLLGLLVVEQWTAYRLSYHPYAMQRSGGSA